MITLNIDVTAKRIFKKIILTYFQRNEIKINECNFKKY